MCKRNNGVCGELQGGNGAESWEWLILPTNITIFSQSWALQKY